MAISILSLDEALEENGLKVLVHGKAGSGKTVLTATAGMPTILISAESGLLSLKKIVRENPKLKKLLKIVTIKSFEDLDETYEWLKSESQLADWIALDSISEIAEQILNHEKKINKDPRAAYGNLTDQMLEKMRGFRDLRGYNVVMTCKQAREEDGDTGKTRFVPMFPGRQVGPAIPYLFDEVFALRVEEDEEGETYRTLQTNRDAHYEAKDRSGELEVFETPNLKEILFKINPDYILLKERTEEIVEETAPVEETESEENAVIIGSKVQYWHHADSDKLMKTSKGDDITKHSEHCTELTKKEFDTATKAKTQTTENHVVEENASGYKCCDCDSALLESIDNNPECSNCGSTDFYQD